MSMLQEKLTIEPTNTGYLLVRQGRRFALLTSDEALFVVAQRILGQPARYLKTYEEEVGLSWYRDTQIDGLLTHNPEQWGDAMRPVR